MLDNNAVVNSVNMKAAAAVIDIFSHDLKYMYLYYKYVVPCRILQVIIAGAAADSVR